MGRLEAGAVSINPHSRSETTYEPDGSLVTTTVETETPKLTTKVGRGHLSEADHVIVAIDQDVPVHYAEASDEAGVTRLGRADATVAAAHHDRGGDGWDRMVIRRIGGNEGAARRRASLIKTNRAHERDAIAGLLAEKGSATGSEMAAVAAEAREDKAKGRKTIVTISVTSPEGRTTSIRRRGREKDRSVRVPGELVAPPSRQDGPPRRRRLPVAA